MPPLVVFDFLEKSKDGRFGAGVAQLDPDGVDGRVFAGLDQRQSRPLNFALADAWSRHACYQFHVYYVMTVLRITLFESIGND
ncbi:MAG: hypothetical protein M3N82_00370 [Pseudomonadota bacterium]|nr:hypothetical protein [Pseudomonadota bacterium]